MLFDNFKLEDILISKEDFQPFEKCINTAVGTEIYEDAITNAERYLDCEWGSLSAVLYMRFVRDGNRTAYENINFARRKALACLALGEYLENKGRFVDDIINGIWCICEESTWVLPAHNGNLPLAFIDKPSVDLFAAQTGAELAFIVYLLKDKLDKVSTAICERAEYEIERRVNTPVLNYNFWWMGFGDDRREFPSNWTAWCGSTCLACALLAENDSGKRLKIVKKLLDVLDYYITEYPSDGGCDEGADYWSMSAGCMFDSLELLYRATGGKLDIFTDDKIRNMADYIRKVSIGGGYFINFADCSAMADIGGMRTYLFAKRVGADKLAEFAAADFRNRTDKTLAESMNMLHKLFAVTEIAESTDEDKCDSESIYIESLELLKVRQGGIVLCAKGGHNADNHNHNDVGSYMVYADDLPVIIDVGVESYSKKTFGSDRYTIWTMQSAYHNLPTVNGIMQSDGREYCAKDLSVTENSIQCDISGAYSPDADIEVWKRCAELKNGTVTVSDSFKLKNPSDDVVITMMTHAEPIIGDCIDVRNTVIEYDSEMWSVCKEKIGIDYDAKLTPVWGDCVYRLLFRIKSSVTDGEFSVNIRRK